MQPTKNSNRSALLGAAFLMATSAIGPGFITQTTVFTQKLAESFGFVILCSIILDIIAQLNIWRIIAVSEKRAPEIANEVMAGMGHFLTVLVVLGGLAFNIGNVAGAGLGFNVLFGIDVITGAIISGIIGILIFWFREAGKAMDRFAKLLGFVMIALTIYVVFKSNPPLARAIKGTFIPDVIDTTAILTLVGGTVGGYITFAGGHRLLDAGIKGRAHIKEVTRSSITAILIASVMRILLFLAAFGIVAAGVALANDNPAASVFQSSAGNIGYKIFGLVLWCAAITSVVGSAYTSVSFMTSKKIGDRNRRLIITGFIAFSTIIFAVLGKSPVGILVFVGTLNGFVLPVSLALMLLAVHRNSMMKGYKHPVVLQVLGWAVVIVMTLMAVRTFT